MARIATDKDIEGLHVIMTLRSGDEADVTLYSIDHMLGLLQMGIITGGGVVIIEIAALYMPKDGIVQLPHGWLLDKNKLEFYKDGGSW